MEESKTSRPVLLHRQSADVLPQIVSLGPGPQQVDHEGWRRSHNNTHPSSSISLHMFKTHQRHFSPHSLKKQVIDQQNRLSFTFLQETNDELVNRGQQGNRCHVYCKQEKLVFTCFNFMLNV